MAPKNLKKSRTNKKATFLTEEECVSELLITNIELSLKIEENEEQAAKLVVRDNQLAAQKKNSATALAIAKKELAYQYAEKGERATELAIANLELAYEEDEKEKRAAELVIANKELIFQNAEKEKRANELLIANKELAFQNKEKGKRAKELLIANRRLSIQNKNLAECADKLTIAHYELSVQYAEKEIKAIELMNANKELKTAQDFQSQYIQNLRHMVFITSHKIRQPIANIMGISNLLPCSINSPDELLKLTGFMKDSALALDNFTRELTIYLCNQESKMTSKASINSKT